MDTIPSEYAQLLASSINRLPNSVLGLDAAGRFVYVNDYAIRHLGYSKNELFSMHYWDIDPSCSPTLYSLNWQNKIPSSLPDNTCHLTKDGRKIPVSIMKSYEENGDTELCIIHVRDNSQFEEQQNLLFNVINQLPSPFLVKDYHGKFVLTNKALAKLYNVESPESMIGKDDSHYIKDLKHADKFKHNVRGIMDAGETRIVYEDSFNAKTGERRNYMSIKKPFTNQRGEKNILVVANDITAIRKAEKTLKQYEKILSVSHDFLALVNRDGIYEAVNDTYVKVFGMKKSEIIGKSLREIVGTGHHARFSEKAFKKSLKGEKYTYQCWSQIPGLGRRFLKANYYPYIPPDSERVEAVAIQVSDFTDQKLMEERLNQAEKMEAIAQVAGGVAHDLNNILSGIVSYPELLLVQLPADHPMRPPLLTIQKTGTKAAAIVEDMLTLSRRGVKNFEIVRLNVIITEYLESPEFIELNKCYPGIQLEKQLAPDLLHIKGSPIHISKSVMNLVGNAIEAMNDGGQLTINTRNIYIDQISVDYEHIPEGEYTVLTIGDTGIGMTSEETKKVFEPFYTKKVMGRSGTGLGMAVVWGTIKDHHGYVDIKSSPGKGTKITLLFPATRESYKSPKKQKDLVKFMGNGETVLVVDDVEEQREIASAILTQLGYNPVTLSSGEHGIDWLKSNHADVVLLDMIMDPGINGLKTYQQISTFKPEQKVVIASGYSENKKLVTALEAGVNGFIKKPYSMIKMAQTIKETFDITDIHG